MKKILSLTAVLFLVISCSQEQIVEDINETAELKKLLSVQEINTFIESELKKSGDIDWTHVEANILYSAVMRGGEVLSVGYGEEGESFVEGTRSSRLDDALQNVYDIIQETEGVAKSNTEIYADDVLNYADIKVSKLETIIALQEADLIRYLEPVGYASYLTEDNAQQKSAGCGTDSESINSNDYRVIAPKALLPWNFDKHNVEKAWDYSTGSGITIGLIDTGVSGSQNLLGNSFNNGFSSGRTVERYGTYIDSPWWWSNKTDGPNDKCGHGTTMASAMVSPRNNSSMPVGVAYNANLVAYRATSDVLLQDYHERKGVSNALKALAKRGDVKIISMSIGYPWSIRNVKDAVKYAYKKGKLIITAGGTSTTFTNWYGVIFPASMKETVAVTGLKDNGYNRCDICHDGKKIDFTIVMQRSGNADRTVPVNGFNTGSQQYVSGSSVATAMTAGVAALVWALNPNMSRDRVLDKLKKSAEFYPNRNSKFGYGNIDALKAVR